MARLIIEARVFNPRTGRTGNGGFAADENTTVEKDPATGFALLKPAGGETFAVVKSPADVVQARLDSLRAFARGWGPENEDYTVNWVECTVKSRSDYNKAKDDLKAGLLTPSRS